MDTFFVEGQLVDLFEKRIYAARITIKDGFVKDITPIDDAPKQYIMPGFVDAHVHIESSMLVPSSFAPLAVVHGTVATVSDPHEIANVNGMEGVQFMIDNGKQTNFKFFFGAPSCVPATGFESAGAQLNADDVAKLLSQPNIWYLSEMMNYPGVLHNDAEVMAKIDAAKKAGKPIDGHAPGLIGEDAYAYAQAGISTDHECTTLQEALGKIGNGMHILIREGSAAKNYEALAPLLGMHPERVMFCSDDKHPDELAMHHINTLITRSLQKGYDLYDVLRVACVNPVMHYKIPIGLLRKGDAADFIITDSLSDFSAIKATYINGTMVAEDGKSLLQPLKVAPINNFKALYKKGDDFKLKAQHATPTIRVIEALEGQLVTNEIKTTGKVDNGFLVSDIENDVLKIVVVNRYDPSAKVSIGFIKNFGLKAGALASTVAHDCHNIIAVGTDDAVLCLAINKLIDNKGGIAVTDGKETNVLPLPIAGLMTDGDGYEVAADYAKIDKTAKELGTTLKAPFMTLSFMALLVIPSLKLSDKGLFNGQKFEFSPVEC